MKTRRCAAVLAVCAIAAGPTSPQAQAAEGGDDHAAKGTSLRTMPRSADAALGWTVAVWDEDQSFEGTHWLVLIPPTGGVIKIGRLPARSSGDQDSEIRDVDPRTGNVLVLLRRGTVTSHQVWNIWTRTSITLPGGARYEALGGAGVLAKDIDPAGQWILASRTFEGKTVQSIPSSAEEEVKVSPDRRYAYASSFSRTESKNVVRQIDLGTGSVRSMQFREDFGCAYQGEWSSAAAALRCGRTFFALDRVTGAKTEIPAQHPAWFRYPTTPHVLTYDLTPAGLVEDDTQRAVSFAGSKNPRVVGVVGKDAYLSDGDPQVPYFSDPATLYLARYDVGARTAVKLAGGGSAVGGMVLSARTVDQHGLPSGRSW